MFLCSKVMLINFIVSINHPKSRISDSVSP